MVEDEQRGRDEAREAAAKAERRVGEINSELEDLRGQLEQVCVPWLSPLNFQICKTISISVDCRLSLISCAVWNKPTR